MSKPRPIEPADAPPEVRAVYDDLCRTRNVPAGWRVPVDEAFER